MSFVRIWVHAVFSTQERQPLLTKEMRTRLFRHIRENCVKKDIYLDAIGGWSEHIHILISLGRSQDIAKIMMLIKGESAHWLNEQRLFRGKFHWQDDYYAVSVSESQVDKVRRYISRQEEHHKAATFEKEMLVWKKIFG